MQLLNITNSRNKAETLNKFFHKESYQSFKSEQKRRNCVNEVNNVNKIFSRKKKLNMPVIHQSTPLVHSKKMVKYKRRLF